MAEQVTLFMQENAILDLIDGMAQELKDLLAKQRIEDPVLIGIHTGGVWVADRIHSLLQCKEPLCSLNISFYRDDFTRIGLNPQVTPSQIPVEIEDRHIILIDDVLQTGRTIRAAMNEIFDFGRPASITLVTLIERDGRELPIEAEIIGLRPSIKQEDYITLTGPSPLQLMIGKHNVNGD